MLWSKLQLFTLHFSFKLQLKAECTVQNSAYAFTVNGDDSELDKIWQTKNYRLLILPTPVKLNPKCHRCDKCNCVTVKSCKRVSKNAKLKFCRKKISITNKAKMHAQTVYQEFGQILESNKRLISNILSKKGRQNRLDRKRQWTYLDEAKMSEEMTIFSAIFDSSRMVNCWN